MSPNVVRIKNLRKSYSEATVLDIPFLELRAGQLTCVLGATGCGKTTLLNILAGADSEFDGEIVYAGSSVPRISYQFQKDLLLPWKTIRDNLTLGFLTTGEPPALGLAERWLSTLDLDSVADSYPAALSTGMRQRAALGRALAWNGDWKLLDEPLSAQDFSRRLSLEGLLREELRKPELIGVVVTHNLEEAIVLGDRIIILGGKPARILDDFEVTGLPENNRPVSARQAPAFAHFLARSAKVLGSQFKQ
jgi:NitT/TauT family transport system ATP-binding protein